MAMSKELRAEVDAGIECMKGDPAWQEDNPGTTEQQYLQYALEEIIDLEKDHGGNFLLGILPDFEGSREWVAKQQAEQAAWLKDFKRQHRAWVKIWKEAGRLLDAIGVQQ